MVGRARTLTVLPRLDSSRKASVLQFLYEAGLISGETIVVKLHNAGLSRVDLHWANLRGAYLSQANLRGAYLSDAYLFEANLNWAILSGADLNLANLSGADLLRADLSRANLRRADLSGANLNGATNLTNEELERQAKSLEGTIMPNGQKYEEWLEDREGRGEDGG